MHYNNATSFTNTKLLLGYLRSSPTNYVNLFPICTMNMTKIRKLLLWPQMFPFKKESEIEKERKREEGVNASLKATTKLQCLSQAVKQEK